jgi:hypothetical protein
MNYVAAEAAAEATHDNCRFVLAPDGGPADDPEYRAVCENPRCAEDRCGGGRSCSLSDCVCITYHERRCAHCGGPAALVPIRDLVTA